MAAANVEAGPKLFPIGEQLMRRWSTIPGVVALTPTIVQPLVGTNVFLGRVALDGQSPAERDASPYIAVKLGEKGTFARSASRYGADGDSSMPIAKTHRTLPW